MVSARTATAAVGLLASLVLSGILWVVFDSLLVFLFVPFIPFLFRGGEERDRPPVRECPSCGFRTRDPEYEYCPRDGHRLD